MTSPPTRQDGSRNKLHRYLFLSRPPTLENIYTLGQFSRFLATPKFLIFDVFCHANSTFARISDCRSTHYYQFSCFITPNAKFFQIPKTTKLIIIDPIPCRQSSAAIQASPENIPYMQNKLCCQLEFSLYEVIFNDGGARYEFKKKSLNK